MNTRTENALAQEKPLTVAEEMAKFGGYTTNNGETVDPKDANNRKGPGDRNLSPEEELAGARVAGEAAERGGVKTGEDKTPKVVELTDKESTAAIDKARTALKLKDDEELTEEEETEALALALTEKKQAAKAAARNQDPAHKRAQEGRRRAEARAARAEGKLATLEQRLAALENGGTKPLTAAAPAAKDGEDKEPDASKFELGELDPKYIRALARWETRQELAENSKTQQTARQTAQQQEAAAEFAAKREAFEDAAFAIYDDFQEVVLDTVSLPKTDPGFWPMSVPMRDMILNSDQGPRIIYALATDPKEAKRVDALPVPAQQRWFYKKEAELEAANPGSGEEGEEEGEEQGGSQRRTTEKPKPREHKAPPPPARRSSGGNGNRGGISPATTDFAAFEAMATPKPGTRG